jgi:hypothetical protein
MKALESGLRAIGAVLAAQRPQAAVLTAMGQLIGLGVVVMVRGLILARLLAVVALALGVLVLVILIIRALPAPLIPRR